MNFILAIVWLVPFAVASSSFFSLFKAHGIFLLFFCTSFVPRAHYWFEFHLECNDFSDLMWFNDSYQCLNAYVSNCALYELVSFPYRSLVNSKFLFAFHIFLRLFALILHWRSCFGMVRDWLFQLVTGIHLHLLYIIYPYLARHWLFSYNSIRVFSCANCINWWKNEIWFPWHSFVKSFFSISCHLFV